MKITDTRTGLEWIDREECLALLARDVVGRMATAIGGSAQTYPVNYVLDGEVIVFRTDPGSKLTAGGRARAAFEIDDIDREHRSGWSVVVSGRLEEVTHYEAETMARRSAPDRPVGRWREGPLHASHPRAHHRPACDTADVSAARFGSLQAGDGVLTERRRGPADWLGCDLCRWTPFGP
jgi:nitroimidazol reductase NimA-like FMN-containing flavoprotein (pyridoxamine 5'-phosphate oxidase superfamily)